MVQIEPVYFTLDVLASPRQLYESSSLNIQEKLVNRVTHLAVMFQIATLGILTSI